MTDRPPQWAGADGAILARLKSRPDQVRLALTGGIASGKSTVAAMFRHLGAAEIDYDHLARQAVEPGTEGLKAVAKLLGPQVLGPDGRLNRPVVRRIVFGQPEKKAGLEAVIHPETWRLMGRELALMETEKVVVITVPLLFEARLDGFFSPIAVVKADGDTRLRRLLKRQPTMGEDEARRIIKSQWPFELKAAKAQFVIDNNGPESETLAQVRQVWVKVNSGEGDA